jgi:pimeloyl-ACP methyl ester carboxylesterase
MAKFGKFFLLIVAFMYCFEVILAQKTSNDDIPMPERIDYLSEDKYVTINGIEQWITIRGNAEKPIILMLHGGPGSVLSPYSSKLYEELEQDFIIVQWDQRGAGRTFGRYAPEELDPNFLMTHPLSVEKMTQDGIAVTEYLLQQYHKEKLILFGTS